ncbi:hypothetical protein [Microbacterium sp. SS28]|uniref:hypothetical protein n=1 Tax=Microbacterium sp. SS28 TaxID=2919948 RepID=UPI001FAA736D|nr:hypothetical protein [Microbacterium sp. SS28]
MHLPPATVGTEVWVDPAAEALQTSNVYVSPDAGVSPELAVQLSDQIGDASIGVAVLPANAKLEAEPTEIVETLMAETEYETIIVAVGDDLAADSDALPEEEALRIANVAQGEDSVEDALVTTIQQISAAAEPAAQPDAPGVDGGVIVGFALAAAVLVGAGIAVVAGLRRRRRGSVEQTSLPEGVEAQLAILRGLVGEYAAVGASGNQVAAQTSPQIAVLADNVSELFARLDRRNVEDQVNIAAVEYDDKLRKLTAAVGRDYLLDILTHPHLWDDPDDRVREVQNALDAVSTELVENIKQVNARRGLLFQVSLDGLIGRRKELQDWDRAFGEAGDDGPVAPGQGSSR